MRTKLFFLVSITLFFNAGLAQDCQDLMISEVVEGWSNNKAIEIYNPTSETIDATEYGLVRFQNGSTTPGNITYLTGAQIAPFEVYVVVIDKRDPDGVDFEAPVWDELQLQADTFVNPNYNDGLEVMYFNGNDAIALLKDDGQTLVDVFGKIGDSLNPDGWGGYIDSEGEQAYVSANHTLVRKPDIIQGYTTNPENFDILSEYDSLAANTFTELGFHICECAADNIQEQEFTEVKVFPNPTADGKVFVSALQSITSIQVYNTIGTLVEEVEISDARNNENLDLSDLDAGIYYVNITLSSGETKSVKVIR